MSKKVNSRGQSFTLCQMINVSNSVLSKEIKKEFIAMDFHTHTDEMYSSVKELLKEEPEAKTIYVRPAGYEFSVDVDVTKLVEL